MLSVLEANHLEAVTSNLITLKDYPETPEILLLQITPDLIKTATLHTSGTAGLSNTDDVELQN